MVDLKKQISQLNSKVNELVEEIKKWPQYRKIGALIILLGFILLIIGILIY